MRHHQKDQDDRGASTEPGPPADSRGPTTSPGTTSSDPIPSLSIGGIEDSLCINRASATGETRAGFEREAARWRAHLADVDDQLEIYAHAGAK